MGLLLLHKWMVYSHVYQPASYICFLSFSLSLSVSLAIYSFHVRRWSHDFYSIKFIVSVFFSLVLVLSLSLSHMSVCSCDVSFSHIAPHSNQFRTSFYIKMKIRFTEIKKMENKRNEKRRRNNEVFPFIFELYSIFSFYALTVTQFTFSAFFCLCFLCLSPFHVSF